MGQWGSVSSTTSKYRVQWVPWVPLRIELCFLDCANDVLDLRWNYSFSNVCNMFLYHVIISLCMLYIMEIITYITYIYNNMFISCYHVLDWEFPMLTACRGFIQGICSSTSTITSSRCLDWLSRYFFCHCHFPLGPTFFSTYGFQSFVILVVDMLWSPDFRGWSWMTTKQRVCPSMLAYPSTTTQTSSHWLIPKAQMGDGCVCYFSNFTRNII